MYIPNVSALCGSMSMYFIGFGFYLRIRAIFAFVSILVEIAPTPSKWCRNFLLRRVVTSNLTICFANTHKRYHLKIHNSQMPEAIFSSSVSNAAGPGCSSARRRWGGVVK